MNNLHFTLITDGSSDRVLIHHLRWMLRRRLGPLAAIQLQWADLRSLREKPRNLAEKIRVSLELYPCDLLFVHRDAENPNPEPRLREITDAVNASGTLTPVVPVVPIRMSEAWLLFDERAVRQAAGNPNGCMPLSLPVRNPERIPNPKALLRNTLKTASGLSGRRLRQFRTASAVYRVAECIDDFSQLQGLAAFNALCKRIDHVVQTQSW